MDSKTESQPLSSEEAGVSALQCSDQVTDASSLARPMSSLTVSRRRVDSDPDEVFELMRLFQDDSSVQKVDLGIGVYRDDDGKPWPMPVVSKVEMKLFFDGGRHRHEYLPMKGDLEFIQVAQDLIFGPGLDDVTDCRIRIVSVQTTGGCGANTVCAKYIANHLRPKRVWLPEYTWSNHPSTWNLDGASLETYRYLSPDRPVFDVNGMCADMEERAEPGDVIVLHACAHNPTGCDPTEKQWEMIADICDRLELVPFFDCAYQGFASGSVDQDAFSMRHFFSRNFKTGMFVAQSFSKNFGLYGHRVGALHVVMPSDAVSKREAVEQQLCRIIRNEHSMAPRRGSDIVKNVLRYEHFTAEWLRDLSTMVFRLNDMRQMLYEHLVELQTPGNWDHIVDQKGMFAFTGLTKEQVLALREKHHVYLLSNGRISLSGLTTRNVRYVAEAIDDVVRTVGPGEEN